MNLILVNRQNRLKLNDTIMKTAKLTYKNTPNDRRVREMTAKTDRNEMKDRNK